ncbi:MAG: Gfo/Idh/MocA family oxidoreductase [Planctomycetota bacterium]
MAEATKTVNLGIVGAGGMGKTHSAAAASLGGRARVAAIVDSNADAATKLAGETGADSFGSVADMIGALKGDLDAVVLCTPPSVREDVVAAALDNGTAVLVEKPLAENRDHAQRLVDLAAKFPGVVTASAYCHRFTPAVREMMRLADAGDIGRVVRWENVFACSIPDMGGKWMSDPAVSGGGSLIDTGCHSLDLFHYMQGGLEAVASVFDRKWDGRGESGATSLVRSPKTGVAGVIMNGWLEPARFLVTLVGEDGILTYDYEQPESLFRTSVAGEKSTIAVETHDVRFAKQMEAFVDAAAGGTRDANLATFADGLAVAQAVEALAASAR